MSSCEFVPDDACEFLPTFTASVWCMYLKIVQATRRTHAADMDVNVPAENRTMQIAFFPCDRFQMTDFGIRVVCWIPTCIGFPKVCSSHGRTCSDKSFLAQPAVRSTWRRGRRRLWRRRPGRTAKPRALHILTSARWLRQVRANWDRMRSATCRSCMSEIAC